jgi:hypothetical protein
MLNLLGLILWIFGILFIIASIYLSNSILIKYKSNKRFEIYFILCLLFIFIFILYRIFSYFYVDYLNKSGLSQEILLEKILFIRMFCNIPFAIGLTLLLIAAYGYLNEIKNK